jgi:hypothetical protein
VCYEANQEQDYENEEADFGYCGRGKRHPSEAQKTSNERYHQKY